MTWNHWALSLCTSAEEVSRGKDSPQRLRRRSMRRSETRNSQLQLRPWPRDTLRSLQFTWTIAAAWNLKRNLILAISANSSRISSIAWDTNTTSFLTGWSRSKTQANPLKSVKKRIRMSQWILLLLQMRLRIDPLSPEYEQKLWREKVIFHRSVH